MRITQGNMLTSLENVRVFLRENADEIGEHITDTTQNELDSSITELGVHLGVQNTRTRVAASALARQRTLREVLIRDHMVPISKIAKLKLSHIPELVSLTLPKKRASLQQLVALAEGMAGAVEPYADVFISAGRKPDFIDQLKKAAVDMQTAAYDRAQHRFNATKASAEVKAKLSRGRKVVHMLDAFMQSALADKPGLLQAWNMAKRVTRKGAVPTTPPAAVATPAADTAAAA